MPKRERDGGILFGWEWKSHSRTNGVFAFDGWMYADLIHISRARSMKILTFFISLPLSFSSSSSYQHTLSSSFSKLAAAAAYFFSSPKCTLLWKMLSSHHLLNSIAIFFLSHIVRSSLRVHESFFLSFSFSTEKINRLFKCSISFARCEISGWKVAEKKIFISEIVFTPIANSQHFHAFVGLSGTLKITFETESRASRTDVSESQHTAASKTRQGRAREEKFFVPSSSRVFLLAADCVLCWKIRIKRGREREYRKILIFSRSTS